MCTMPSPVRGAVSFVSLSRLTVGAVEASVPLSRPEPRREPSGRRLGLNEADAQLLVSKYLMLPRSVAERIAPPTAGARISVSWLPARGHRFLY